VNAGRGPRPISGALAQSVTAALRRRWPGAAVTSTAAGRGRVAVTLPLAQARALRLAGRDADTAAAGAELAELLGRPVRVIEARRLPPDPGRTGARYAVLIDLGA
jgi:hypothetical protein